MAKKINKGLASFLAKKKAGKTKSPNQSKMSMMGKATGGRMK